MSYKSAKELWRKVLPAAFVVITTLALSGCTDIDGDLASERDVLHEVAEQVPTEGYELMSVDHDTESRPKVDTYHFASTERDLKFDVISTLMSFGIDGGVIGYNQHISVKYADAVHELYRDRIEALLEDYPLNKYNKHEYSSYAALGNVADALVACDQVYRQELQYNTTEWLKENPVEKLMFAYPYLDDEGTERELFTTTVSVDGSLQRDALYERITYDHVHECVNQNVADVMIPEDQYARVHSDNLNIYVGTHNLSTEGPDKAFENGLYNNTDSAYQCAYYYDWDTYVMPINLGLTDETYAPQLVELYCDALGYRYEVDYKKGRVHWTVDGGADVSGSAGDWELQAEDNRNSEITKFEVYHDGVKQDVKWISYGSPNYPGGPMYCLFVAMDDFGKMFGVDCQVDESNGMVVLR